MNNCIENCDLFSRPVFTSLHIEPASAMTFENPEMTRCLKMATLSVGYIPHDELVHTNHIQLELRFSLNPFLAKSLTSNTLG